MKKKPLLTGLLLVVFLSNSVVPVNCQTGAITFKTSGGNGSLIEYQAAGITSWSTNPNQFVNKGHFVLHRPTIFYLCGGQLPEFSWIS